MQREPFFNIPEKLPLNICGFLIVMFVLQMFGPAILKQFFYGYFILIPFGYENVSLSRQMISLIGHGTLHAGLMHLLVNCGMLIALGSSHCAAYRLFFEIVKMLGLPT